MLLQQLHRQWWSPDGLARLQQRRLITLVRHAYEQVPHYRRCFEKVGLNPYDFHGIEDLQRIPITHKADLVRLNVPDIIAQNATIDQLKHHTTGGSTGVPFTIFSPPNVENKRVASLMATFIVNGYRPHEKIALFQANPPRLPSLIGSACFNGSISPTI
jgi:phenylacetate-CoA ligase